MKIAVIGQSLFGQEVYKELKKEGHTIVGVFTIPDKDGKADPLGDPLIPLVFFVMPFVMSSAIILTSELDLDLVP